MTVQTTLFRAEAVEFQRQSGRLGRVASLQPISTKIFTWLITIAVIVGGIFLFVGTYARKEPVVGYLTPRSGTSKVFAPQPGIIKQVHVVEGQDVQQGQPLITVETSHIADNGEDVNGAMVETLRGQQQLLKRQIEAEQRRVPSEEERLTAKIAILQNEMTALQDQIDAQRKRIQISEEFVAAADQLSSKGFLADSDLKKRQLAVLEQQQNQAALSQQLSAREDALTEARYSLRQLPTLMAEKIQSFQNDLSLTEQRIDEVNGRRAYVIRAPAAGRVSTLQASAGQYADPTRLQLELVPSESILEAQLFVPTRAIGFVKPGQPVRILYDAFPYQRFGVYSARIVTVSKTILTASDANGPIALKEPAYRVTAALDRQDVDARDQKMPLQADMLLRADIMLERRTLIEWLFNPLLSVRM